MNKEQVAGKFEQVKGSLKATWGKLTDNDITLYDGKREQFLGKLKEHYGLEKEAAEKKVQALEEACGCGRTTNTAKIAREADSDYTPSAERKQGVEHPRDVDLSAEAEQAPDAEYDPKRNPERNRNS